MVISRTTDVPANDEVQFPENYGSRISRLDLQRRIEVMRVEHGGEGYAIMDWHGTVARLITGDGSVTYSGKMAYTASVCIVKTTPADTDDEDTGTGRRGHHPLLLPPNYDANRHNTEHRKTASK